MKNSYKMCQVKLNSGVQVHLFVFQKLSFHEQILLRFLSEKSLKNLQKFVINGENSL